MPVKFKMVHGSYFPGDIAGFDEDTEAELVESGKAEPFEAEEADAKDAKAPPASKAAKAPATKG